MSKIHRYIAQTPIDSLTKNLHKLGLTKQEARIYEFLVKAGKATASRIALSLRIPLTAVYRSAHNLNRLGFLGEQRTRPLEFISVPQKLAVPSYIRNRQDVFEKITRELFSRSPGQKEKSSPTRVNMVFGEKEMFASGVSVFNRARSEILVISIGQELPPELLLAQKNAVARGVKSRMIAHKSDKTNRQVLASFKANGIEVRHYPDWGFHLVVVDDFYAMVAANNPKNTKERVGIEFYNRSLSHTLRDYFYSVWEKAKPV